MLIGWLPVVLVVISAGFLTAVVVYYIRRCSRAQNHNTPENLQSGIARLHTSISHHHLYQDRKKKQNYQIFRRGVSSKPLFNWSDNPLLVTDAVENGWSRFAFMSCPFSPSTRSTRSLLGVCTTGDQVRDTEVDISWEVCQGSADFMQKIRLNSGLNKIFPTNYTSSMAALSVIKTALPLPGPLLGNNPSFPQEAYFEITVLSRSEDDDYEFSKGSKVEGEKIKLIHEDSTAKSNSESLIHITSTNFAQIQESTTINDDKKDSEGGVMLSVGLTGVGSVPLKLPGSYPGSIGFNSNGSVYLDGIKVMVESEIMEEWGRTDTVIGCGYSPNQHKVFFTMDSEVMHEFTCKSEEFGSPMYPTLAANSDVTVIVNFGQRAFKYLPANVNRTSNPCFIGPLANSSSLGYEDSKELFSMGRIDSQWLHASATKSANDYNRGGSEFDDFSEGDLFEIVLESSRTPKTPI